MRPRQIVTIYHDPFTKLNAEGQAELVREYRPDEGDGLAMWEVGFVDDPGIVCLRTIWVPPIRMVVCAGCGTKIQAVDSIGNPVCPICVGVNANSGEPKEVELPATMRCKYCNREARGNLGLPYAQPERGLYYCGCRGWD